MSNLVYEPDTRKRPDFRIDDLPEILKAALLTIAHDKTGQRWSWDSWAALARGLGQECARRCWVYPGPVSDPTPPVDRAPISSRLKVIET